MIWKILSRINHAVTERYVRYQNNFLPPKTMIPPGMTTFSMLLESNYNMKSVEESTWLIEINIRLWIIWSCKLHWCLDWKVIFNKSIIICTYQIAKIDCFHTIIWRFVSHILMVSKYLDILLVEPFLIIKFIVH